MGNNIVKICVAFTMLVLATSAIAQPKFSLIHQRNDRNLAEIQIKNNTLETLICYVAIDGHKIYFRLQANQPSIWYNATDPRYNFSNFSTWCDYLSLHPKYMPKRR
jgi:hypothetical protein